jgi:hypothetical protein
MVREKNLRHRGESGQTIILVAVCIVSLLAMAALAVDVVTLYVAKGEIQHAADAAALAGAKAFVESAVTTDPASTTLQGIAQTIACPDASCSSGYIAQALAQNPVSGSPATINPSSPVAYDFTNHQGNPRITVSLQRTNLPIFFARIWSSNLASVSATATAEAFNASNSQNNTGALVPAAPQCVKPILVRNTGRGGTGPIKSPFVNRTDGTVGYPQNAPAGFVGQEFTLSSVACGATPACVRYEPAVAPTAHNFCSSCALALPSASDYQLSIACCDGSAYNFTQCGEAGATTTSMSGMNPAIPTGNGPTQTATQCAIHASGPGLGNGQDILDKDDFLINSYPFQIQAGPYSAASLGVASNAPISTGDSIMTLPIYDDCAACVPPPPVLPTVTVVGFLQVFVNSVDTSGGLDVTILNVIGCGNAGGSGPAISGGGISAVPVRLVSPGG